eukprot:TRINITY_DN3476_c0_g1_i1.p1 TRINITY_DN3476_c0_g1~~TRINITY_DN3476_c0_g1_i1.p1  ORF type:complete len:221 (+),score=32.90 TRINITY_DN3476_c0_g1_i1:72-734(+)
MSQARRNRSMSRSAADGKSTILPPLDLHPRKFKRLSLCVTGKKRDEDEYFSSTETLLSPSSHSKKDTSIGNTFASPRSPKLPTITSPAPASPKKSITIIESPPLSPHVKSSVSPQERFRSMSTDESQAITRRKRKNSTSGDVTEEIAVFFKSVGQFAKFALPTPKQNRLLPVAKQAKKEKNKDDNAIKKIIRRHSWSHNNENRPSIIYQYVSSHFCPGIP